MTIFYVKKTLAFSDLGLEEYEILKSRVPNSGSLTLEIFKIWKAKCGDITLGDIYKALCHVERQDIIQEIMDTTKVVCPGNVANTERAGVTGCQAESAGSRLLYQGQIFDKKSSNSQRQRHLDDNRQTHVEYPPRFHDSIPDSNFRRESHTMAGQPTQNATGNCDKGSQAPPNVASSGPSEDVWHGNPENISLPGISKQYNSSSIQQPAWNNKKVAEVKLSDVGKEAKVDYPINNDSQYDIYSGEQKIDQTDVTNSKGEAKESVFKNNLDGPFSSDNSNLDDDSRKPVETHKSSDQTIPKQVRYSNDMQNFCTKSDNPSKKDSKTSGSTSSALSDQLSGKDNKMSINETFNINPRVGRENENLHIASTLLYNMTDNIKDVPTKKEKNISGDNEKALSVVEKRVASKSCTLTEGVSEQTKKKETVHVVDSGIPDVDRIRKQRCNGSKVLDRVDEKSLEDGESEERPKLTGGSPDVSSCGLGAHCSSVVHPPQSSGRKERPGSWLDMDSDLSSLKSSGGTEEPFNGKEHGVQQNCPEYEDYSLEDRKIQCPPSMNNSAELKSIERKAKKALPFPLDSCTDSIDTVGDDEDEVENYHSNNDNGQISERSFSSVEASQDETNSCGSELGDTVFSHDNSVGIESSETPQREVCSPVVGSEGGSGQALQASGIASEHNVEADSSQTKSQSWWDFSKGIFHFLYNYLE